MKNIWNNYAFLQKILSIYFYIKKEEIKDGLKWKIFEKYW